MALDGYNAKWASGEVMVVPVVVTGAGAANPTKVLGNGVTVTWVSTGKYRLTFADGQGTFVGALSTVANTGPTALTPRWAQADYDSYTAAGKALDVYTTTPATEAVAAALSDLTTAMTMTVLVLFRRTAA